MVSALMLAACDPSARFSYDELDKVVTANNAFAILAFHQLQDDWDGADVEPEVTFVPSEGRDSFAETLTPEVSDSWEGSMRVNGWVEGVPSTSEWTVNLLYDETSDDGIVFNGTVDWLWSAGYTDADNFDLGFSVHGFVETSGMAVGSDMIDYGGQAVRVGGVDSVTLSGTVGSLPIAW